MKVVVTGGAGYVGSVTSRLLLDAGVETHTLYNADVTRTLVSPYSRRRVTLESNVDGYVPP